MKSRARARAFAAKRKAQPVICRSFDRVISDSLASLRNPHVRVYMSTLYIYIYTYARVHAHDSARASVYAEVCLVVIVVHWLRAYG